MKIASGRSKQSDGHDCDHEACSLPDQLSMMRSESSFSAKDSSQNEELGEIEEPTVETESSSSSSSNSSSNSSSSSSSSSSISSSDLEENEDFGAWLKFVSQCLKGHPNMTAARRKKEAIFEVVEEKEESEEERCLRVVRSVLDEETVLEMATDFLQMTRGADVPHWASLSFKSCNFDREKGEFPQTCLDLLVQPRGVPPHHLHQLLHALLGREVAQLPRSCLQLAHHQWGEGAHPEKSVGYQKPSA